MVKLYTTNIMVIPTVSYVARTPYQHNYKHYVSSPYIEVCSFNMVSTTAILSIWHQHWSCEHRVNTSSTSVSM